MSLYDQYDQTLVSEQAAKQSFLLKIAAHRPANKQEVLNQLADRSVAIHPAGNSRAISLAIFDANPNDPVAIDAAITALV